MVLFLFSFSVSSLVAPKGLLYNGRNCTVGQALIHREQVDLCGLHGLIGPLEDYST
jgi:hypothetical protein